MKAYAPWIDYAYKQMRLELELRLNEAGKVKKRQTRKDPMGERSKWVYEVYDDKGQLIVEVNYNMGDENVVKIKGTLSEKVKKYFTIDFDKNFKKKEKQFKI